MAVDLGSVGVDAGVLDRLAVGQPVIGRPDSKLVAVVGQHAVGVSSFGLCGDRLRLAERAWWSAAGFGLAGGRGQVTRSGQAYGGVAGLDRRHLPDRVGGAFQPTDEEAVNADQLAGPLDLDVWLWLAAVGGLVGGVLE